MKRNALTLLLLAALVLVPAWAGDGEDVEPPEDEAEVVLTTGYQGSSVDGEVLRAAEHDDVDNTSIEGLMWRSSPYAKTTAGFDFLRKSSYDSKAAATLDVQRVARIRATLDGFIHRTDNDPLDNLQAISEIKTVRRSDLDLGVDYQIRNRLYDVQAEFQHPSVPSLTYRAGYRSMQRKGTRQVLSTAHCTSCHTIGQGRDVDQATNDVTAGVHWTKGDIDLDYEVMGRAFAESGAQPFARYDIALRPAPPGWSPFDSDPLGSRDPLNVPADTVAPFNDRVWFQDTNQPIDVIPEVRRQRHKLKFRTGFDGGSALNLMAVVSNTENRTTTNDYDFSAYRASYLAKLSGVSRLNAYASYEKLENKSVSLNFEDIFGPAPVTSYGGFPGPITYQDWRRADGTPAFLADPIITFNSLTRSSALDRETSRLGLNWVWRPVRRGSFTAGAEWEEVDRDNVVLGDGTGKTTTTELRAAWNQRFRKRVRLNARVKYVDTDNPYMIVGGGLRAYVEDPDNPGSPLGVASTPKSPDSLQYYELHTFRTANLSVFPTADLNARVSGSWTPKGKNWSVSANARYRDSDNDELNRTDWTQNHFGVGANVLVAGGSKWLFNLGVDHSVKETDAEAIIPLMDG